MTLRKKTPNINFYKHPIYSSDYELYNLQKQNPGNIPEKNNRHPHKRQKRKKENSMRRLPVKTVRRGAKGKNKPIKLLPL